MNKAHKILVGAAFAFASISAFAADPVKVDTKGGTSPYVVDANGALVQGPSGACWRTGYWTLDLAKTVKTTTGDKFPVGCYCDKEALPKELCEPPKAMAKAAPAPAAKPKPMKKAAPAPVAAKVTIPSDALFAFGKADISSAGQAKLSDFAASLNGINLEVVIAVGHADRIGKADYNQMLSEKRAEAVKAFLVSKGIDPNRVYTEGKGSDQSVTGEACNNMGAANGGNKKLVNCLAPDRRVDLEAVGSKK